MGAKSDRSPEETIPNSIYNLEFCRAILKQAICCRCVAKPKHCKECGIEAMLIEYEKVASMRGYLKGVAEMKDTMQDRGPAGGMHNRTD